MKIYVLSLLLLSHLSFAGLPVGEIKNFTGEYLDPHGTANSETFNFDKYQFGNNVKFAVHKQAGSLFLETPEETIEVEAIPDLILDLNTVKWDNISLASTKSNLSLNIDSLGGVSSDKYLQLDQLRINCSKSNYNSTAMDEILDSCLNKEASISLDNIQINTQKANTTISNLRLNSKNNKMSYQIKASGYNIKGHGETYFEKNLVRIKISTAKVGFLNVRGKFFSELRKMESATIRVNEPWIEIDLNR